METLDQGLATALVLVGLAAMLFGVAALWRAVANAKAHQQELRLEQEAHERASERFRERATRDRGQSDLLLALIPAGTALLGHWLGRQSLPPSLDPYPAPCLDCIPRPPRPMPSPLDDDETIEIDLRSLLDAFAELGFDRWLANLMRSAKASPAQAPVDDDPEPTPGVAPGMS